MLELIHMVPLLGTDVLDEEAAEVAIAVRHCVGTPFSDSEKW